MNQSRRNFIKIAGTGTAVLAVGGVLPGFSAKSYSRIVGANDRVGVAVAGVNGRGTPLARYFARLPQSEVVALCDVDSRALEKCIAGTAKIQERNPKGEKDIRKMLEDQQVDAVVIAMPDHWHTPAALLSLQAGKHVYLEKPVSHNPREGEMLVEASARYGKVVQIGTQRRSWPKVVEAISEVQNGVIGKPYFGKAWYTNNRTSIGTGKTTEVPAWLDWNLWQGPAPRSGFRDNIVHYNWHWFWHWGTGEALNNGTHMVDLLCWGMGLDYPTRVHSAGGRYHYRDDWETPDTQVISMDFGDRASISWEGRSCNGKHVEGSSVGVIFFGENGSLFISGGNDYKIFDKANKVVKEVKSDITIDPRNTINPSEQLDLFHIQNFLDGIIKGSPLNMTPEAGHRCTLLMQLGNIAQRVGRSLQTDPKNGQIIGDTEAQQLWGRSYEPGWEPRV